MTTSAIVALRAQRRAVVVERRRDGISEDKIAAELGISRYHVHQFIKSATARGELEPVKPPVVEMPLPLLADAAEDNWRKRAACRDVDPDLFFPVGSSGPALIQAAQAKAVCAGCDVADQCLQWALATGSNDGIWGGLTEAERRQYVQILAAR